MQTAVQTVASASTFTPTEYVLGGVVAALAMVIVRMAFHIHKQNDERRQAQLEQAEARRQAEIAAVERVMPLAHKIGDVVAAVTPILQRIPDMDALVQRIRDATQDLRNIATDIQAHERDRLRRAADAA